MLKDDKAQIGGIIMFVFAIFAIGFIYILLGVIPQAYVDENNALIQDTNIAYSQGHKDSANASFFGWWLLPVIALLICIIYAIKNAIADITQEAY